MRRPTGDEVLRIAKRTLQETKQDRVTTFAAGLAFHWFLALFPAALVLLGICDLVGLSGTQVHSLVHGVGQIMPDSTATVIDQALKQRPSEGAGVFEIVIGSIIALWSATESMASLQVGLDVAFEVERDRGFIGRRLMGIPLLLVTLVLGGSASAVLVFGDPIRSLLSHHLAILGPSAAVLWDIVRWVAACVLVTVLLSTYYALGPRREKREWHLVTIGGFVATGGWLLASLGFSFYVGHLGGATRSYGAFADVAILLLWLFVTALMVLIGAEINSEIAREAEARAGRLASVP